MTRCCKRTGQAAIIRSFSLYPIRPHGRRFLDRVGVFWFAWQPIHFLPANVYHSSMRAVRAGIVVLALGALGAAPRAGASGNGAVLRLQGSVEPVRSHPVIVPRLTGPGTGTLVIVHLVKPGTRVRRGDLLIEFDRQAQIKTAHDREAEYRDFVEQINRKRGEQITARAHGEAELVIAGNAVKSADLEVLKNEIVPPVTAEQNRLSLDEARAKAEQLRRTFDLRRKADAADVRAIEIQRDRALNAWKHARSNADRMRVVSPIDGMVVLKSTWKNGTMGEVQEGEEVRSGLGIMDVIDSSVMQVRARVNQADVSALGIGQPARITLDSYPGRTFTGRLEQLSRIGAISTMSNRVRTFLAVFSIQGSDPHLMPDLAAAVDVSGDRR
jgi:HlyD family secretion protein